MIEVTEQPEGDWEEETWSDGTRTFHATEGIVFLRVKYQGDIYYVSVDDNRRHYEDVRAGLFGVETNAFHHALVRRKGHSNGFFTGYAYYPLPLIFASPDERRIAAEAISQKAPPERWARRRRTEVSKYLNYEKEGAVS